MKQQRPYPVYTVTPKAERSLDAGHPWVYGEEITAAPEVLPENGAPVDVVSRRGELSGHRLSEPAQQDPGAHPQPQRQRPL